jgi:RimJ/RimL family protein N-acetyltransferase
LHVRASNEAAIALYKQAGFVENPDAQSFAFLPFIGGRKGDQNLVMVRWL